MSQRFPRRARTRSRTRGFRRGDVPAGDGPHRRARARRRAERVRPGARTASRTPGSVRHRGSDPRAQPARFSGGAALGADVLWRPGLRGDRRGARDGDGLGVGRRVVASLARRHPRTGRRRAARGACSSRRQGERPRGPARDGFSAGADAGRPRAGLGRSRACSPRSRDSNSPRTRSSARSAPTVGSRRRSSC